MNGVELTTALFSAAIVIVPTASVLLDRWEKNRRNARIMHRIAKRGGSLGTNAKPDINLSD